jgi:hypothetical protein
MTDDITSDPFILHCKIVGILSLITLDNLPRRYSWSMQHELVRTEATEVNNAKFSVVPSAMIPVEGLLTVA